jgi:Domain of unknown function (DUF4345)
MDMPPENEKRLLQTAIALFALIPIGAGLAGAWLGPSFTDAAATNMSLDSHFRYLSGLLLGIGLGYWSTIASIERQSPRFRLLTLIVFIGGLARLWGLVDAGMPPTPMLGGLVMELVVTPLLCLWQWRIANAFQGD